MLCARQCVLKLVGQKRKEEEKRSESMLYKRWRQALRNRQSGAGCKPPLGAMVKSHGAERSGKGGKYPSGRCHEAE